MSQAEDLAAIIARIEHVPFLQYLKHKQTSSRERLDSSDLVSSDHVTGSTLQSQSQASAGTGGVINSSTDPTTLSSIYDREVLPLKATSSREAVCNSGSERSAESSMSSLGLMSHTDSIFRDSMVEGIGHHLPERYNAETEIQGHEDLQDILGALDHERQLVSDNVKIASVELATQNFDEANPQEGASHGSDDRTTPYIEGSVELSNSQSETPLTHNEPPKVPSSMTQEELGEVGNREARQGDGNETADVSASVGRLGLTSTPDPEAQNSEQSAPNRGVSSHGILAILLVFLGLAIGLLVLLLMSTSHPPIAQVTMNAV